MLGGGKKKGAEGEERESNLCTLGGVCGNCDSLWSRVGRQCVFCACVLCVRLHRGAVS